MKPASKLLVDSWQISGRLIHDNGNNLELLPWKHGKQRLFGGSGGSPDPVLPRACSEVLNADSPLILAASTTATIRRVLSWLMNRTMNRIMSRSNEPDSRRIPNGFRADSKTGPHAADGHRGWSKNDYRMGVVAQLANGHSARRFSRLSSSAPPPWRGSHHATASRRTPARVWGILDLLHSTYEASVGAPARMSGFVRFWCSRAHGRTMTFDNSLAPLRCSSVCVG